MNPFDLRGPEFLGFFFVLVVAVIAAVAIVRRRMEGGPIPKLKSIDPYLIAYLRSGTEEAIRVAVVSLVDRGLLKYEAGFVVNQVGPEDVRRPLERVILAAASTPRQPAGLCAIPAIRDTADQLGNELVEQGLMRGPEHIRRRRRVAAVAIGFLWCVALVKIGVAIGRGRSNVGYLVLLSCFATVGVMFVAFRGRRTRMGTRLVGDLRTLFGGLKDRSHEIPAGGATNELALLAGVFGLAALEGTALAPHLRLFPRPAPSSGGGQSTAANGAAASCGATADWGMINTSSSWTDTSHGSSHTSCGSSASSCGSSASSCGSSASSCGSSGGSSCGSSCGGGGGGCGGCGS